MAIRDICNAALLKNHWTELIPDTVDWLNPVGKAQIICAEHRHTARRAALRMGYWTCVMRRTMLASLARKALTTYVLGDLIISGTDVYKCTVAGKTGSTAPTWSTTAPVVDGTVTWKYSYSTTDPLSTENRTGLAYSSPLPANYIILKDVCDSAANPIHFIMEGHTVYTDIPNPVLVYVPDEEDDTKWDALLRNAVVLELAAEIAGPLTADFKNEAVFAQELQYLIDSAFSKTSREHRQGMPRSDEWAPGLFSTRIQ